MYSQTTKSPEGYKEITKEIKRRVDKSKHNDIKYIVNDTLCRQVSGREPQLKKFSTSNDIIIFVSGRKSSNGKMLYESCKRENQNSHFISDIDELKTDWFHDVDSVGICGATSTPRWLMESVKSHIEKIA